MMSVAEEHEQFEAASARLAELIAEQHGFDLASLNLTEARRLQGHLEAIEPGRYESTVHWPTQLIWAARARLLSELRAKIPDL